VIDSVILLLHISKSIFVSFSRLASFYYLLAPILQPHTICIIGHRPRPVGKDAFDPNLPPKDIQDLIHLAVIVDSRCNKAIIVLPSLRHVCQRARPLESPGDDVQPHGLRCRSLGARDDCLVVWRSQEVSKWWRNYVHALLLQ
jgi:hypothetical protein